MPPPPALPPWDRRAPPPPFWHGLYAPAPAFIDLDGDGDLELVMGFDEDGVGVLLAFDNLGDGTLAPFSPNPFAGLALGNTPTPSAFVAKVAEAMVLDRVPEVAVGVLEAAPSGVAGQEACESAAALLSNIASMGQPEACRAVGAAAALERVLAEYAADSTQTIANRALTALVGSYE